MRPERIDKVLAALPLPPNMSDRDAVCRSFSWNEAQSALAGLAGGGLNIAHEAVARHALGERHNHVALRLLAADGGQRDIAYDELHRLSNRFANVLTGLGIGQGDRVFVLCGRRLELYLAVLGAFKVGAVVSPLFSAFGPEPIATRVQLGQGALLVTSTTLYRRKVAPMRSQMPSLRQVLLIDADAPSADLASEASAGTLDLARLMAEAQDEFTITPTRPDDPALLHFTSGTTGTPKGALHVHGAALTHYITGKYALDLHPQDIYWCTADPGWVTGTSYGIIAPLLHGVTSIIDEAEFDVEHWYHILQEQQVSVWYTAPTAIRMLMRAGPELAHQFHFPALRFIASVGEPLNSEAVWWGADVLGLPIHDNWWQTETGGIMIANTVAMPIKPGSMGKPLPGVEAFIVRHQSDQNVEVLDVPDAVGELALKAGWPSMFRGYLGQDERYRKCFSGGLYLTGDMARRDADGYYWFVGRTDDVIKSSGHLIGPFEVESALMEHPAVAEAAVIGKPDEMVGEVVKAFVTLKRGVEASEALRAELLGHARKLLGAAVAPKEIVFLPSLPHTRSGKIMRRLLKARELGLPEGDLSTLEEGT